MSGLFPEHPTTQATIPFMQKVKWVQTLFAYDGPQIFEAETEDGLTKFLGLMVEKEPLSFAMIPLSFDAVRDFKAGRVDLRTAIDDRLNKSWYFAQPTAHGGEELELTPGVGNLPTDVLPEKNFYLSWRGDLGGPSQVDRTKASREYLARLAARRNLRPPTGL